MFGIRTRLFVFLFSLTFCCWAQPSSGSRATDDLTQLEQKLLNLDQQQLKQSLLTIALQQNWEEALKRAELAEKSLTNAQELSQSLTTQVNQQQEQLENALALCEALELKYKIWRGVSIGLACTTVTVVAVCLLVNKIP